MAQQKTEWVLELKDLMSRKLDGVDDEVVNLQKDFKKLVDEIETPNTDGLDDIKKATEGNAELMGEAQAAALDFFSALSSGDAVAASASLRSLQMNMKGLASSGLAFATSPIGIAILALAGIGLATREWVKFNEQAREANIQVKGITQAADRDLSSLRVRAQALSDTFGGDWTEHLRNVNSLQKGFEISSKEAFNQYTQGMIRGGAQNEEFASSIKEYPKLFKQGQFSAQEFLNIIENSQAVGVWSDKLPDAIKEFSISVQEQTPAAKKALDDAFGPKFTNTMFAGIRDGSLSTRDALAMVSAESKKTQLDQQKQATLTADLFRAAGEDAAGFAQVIDIVDQSLNGEQKALSGVQQKLNETARANMMLKAAQAAALESDIYKEYATDVANIWTGIKTKFYMDLTQIQVYFKNFYGNVKATFGGISSVVDYATDGVFDNLRDLKTEIMDVVDAFMSAGNIWDTFKNEGFTAGVQAAKDWKNNLLKEAQEVKEGVEKVAVDGALAYSDGVIDSIKKNQEDAAAKVAAYDALNPTGTTASTGANGGGTGGATGALGINGGNGASGRIINMKLDISNVFNVVDGKRADVQRMADEIIGVVVDRLRDSAIALG